MDAFLNPNSFTFLIFKFNFPCGSHFMAYFKDEKTNKKM